MGSHACLCCAEHDSREIVERKFASTICSRKRSGRNLKRDEKEDEEEHEESNKDEEEVE